jgi:hypothetical protein
MQTEKDTSSEGFESPSFEEVWKKLSEIDVNDKKKDLTDTISYLSWSWAWGELMEHYPYATYSFDEDQWDHLGYCTVSCTVRIGHLERTMWLPVMQGYSHKAVMNPDARGRSDTRMRCLVKAIAMFGLGHYIYNGEDFPRKEDDLEQEEQAQVPNDDDKAKDFAESIKQKLKQATTEKQAMHVFDNDPDQRQWLEQQYPTLYAELGQLCMDKLDQIKNGE